MGLQSSNNARIPVFSGTAAALAAMTTMITGDLFYTTDTKLLYTYDGAAWNSVLGGIVGSKITLVGGTSGSVTNTGAWTAIGSQISIAAGTFAATDKCFILVNQNTATGSACWTQTIITANAQTMTSGEQSSTTAHSWEQWVQQCQYDSQNGISHTNTKENVQRIDIFTDFGTNNWIAGAWTIDFQGKTDGAVTNTARIAVYKIAGA